MGQIVSSSPSTEVAGPLAQAQRDTELLRTQQMAMKGNANEIASRERVANTGLAANERISDKQIGAQTNIAAMGLNAEKENRASQLEMQLKNQNFMASEAEKNRIVEQLRFNGELGLKKAAFENDSARADEMLAQQRSALEFQKMNALIMGIDASNAAFGSISDDEAQVEALKTEASKAAERNLSNQNRDVLINHIKSKINAADQMFTPVTSMGGISYTKNPDGSVSASMANNVGKDGTLDGISAINPDAGIAYKKLMDGGKLEQGDVPALYTVLDETGNYYNQKIVDK